jgi:hypothetical protein
MRRRRTIIIVRRESAGFLDGMELFSKMIFGFFIFGGWVLYQIGKFIIIRTKEKFNNK